MFQSSDESLKPLLAFIWVAIFALLMVGVLLGSWTIKQVFIIVLIGIALYLVLASGIYKPLFYIHLQNTSVVTQIKGHFINFASSLIYPLLFLGLFLFKDSARYEKAVTMTVLSLLSVFWLFVLYRRLRLIEDTASTKLNSAAQGYAELEGQVTLYDGEVVRGPHQELPVMVWFRKYLLSSSAGFILDDGNGRCTVDPRDAEVITPTYHYNGHRYHAIYPGETIYVLGYFETLSKQRTEYERKALASSRLVEWKRHHFKFLDFFDSNKDGEINDQEMRTAREAADRTIDNELESIYLEPATHFVSSPVDSRPFILSSIHPDELIHRYKRAMIFHLIAWVTLSIFVLAMQVN